MTQLHESSLRQKLEEAQLSGDPQAILDAETNYYATDEGLRYLEANYVPTMKDRAYVAQAVLDSDEVMRHAQAQLAYFRSPEGQAYLEQKSRYLELALLAALTD